MYKFVDVMLPDNLYNGKDIPYFKEHPEKLKALNKREFVILPIDVALVVRQSVITIVRQHFVENPEPEVKESIKEDTNVVKKAAPKVTKMEVEDSVVVSDVPSAKPRSKKPKVVEG